MAVRKPWAILLCRWSDDANDPAATTVAALHDQWGQTHTAAWMAANIAAEAALDPRTILELYQHFFTVTGIFTWNVVRYFDEMSHGQIDVGDSQVFPCRLGLSAAEVRAKSRQPGGTAFQVEMFQLAKQALKAQHAVDWTDYFGVVVSFQSDVAGAQGYAEIDGGPGVFADVRFVRNNGTTAWGHEMGHGFALNHSRTDGEFTSACTGGDPSDYTDPWDIMSAVDCAQFSADDRYGAMGPGMNAWNMRAYGGLDESRVWKGIPFANGFSQRVKLRPLHQRNLPGYLAAELPGIGGHSAYLVEFRMPEFWDAMFASPVVIVHRFAAPYSYVMKGTLGQKILVAGSSFETGTGPVARVKVEAIDAAAREATISLCYHATRPQAPSVKIVADPPPAGVRAGLRKDACRAHGVADGYEWFGFAVTGDCVPTYRVDWSVQGGALAGTARNDTFAQVLLPAAGEQVTITVRLTFDDGTSVFDAYTLTTIAQEQAAWLEFICRLLQDERKLPDPWWRWEPARIAAVLPKLSPASRRDLLTRADALAAAVRRAADG